jgi:hypothetical protein
VIYRAKRQKYIKVKYNEVYELKNALNEALNGNGQWLKCPAELSFVARKDDL